MPGCWTTPQSAAVQSEAVLRELLALAARFYGIISRDGGSTMRKTALISPVHGVGSMVAVLAFLALPASGLAAEESKRDKIGPWEIEAVFKADEFDRCLINRKLDDDVVASFVRTGDALTLQLESPNWKLDRGKDYPVKMTLGPLSFDTEVAAEPSSVLMEIKDKKFEAGLRSASALNIVAAGATIKVPLDKSADALERLDQCVEKNDKAVASNPFVAPARRP
jgi:hypothetical protein